MNEVEGQHAPKKTSTAANFKDAFRGSSKTVWVAVLILGGLIYAVFPTNDEDEGSSARAGSADVAAVTRNDETTRNRGQQSTLPTDSPYLQDAAISTDEELLKIEKRGGSHIADVLDQGVENGKIADEIGDGADGPDYSNLLVGTGKQIQEVRVDIAEDVGDQTGKQLKQPRANPEPGNLQNNSQLLRTLSQRYRVDAAIARAATQGRIVYLGAETINAFTAPDTPDDETTGQISDLAGPVAVVDGPSLSVGIGDYVYAYFVSGVDTDSPGPAILEIYGGDLDGARLIAQYAVIGERVHMQFGQLFLNGQTHAVKLIAVDDTFTPGVPLEVNNHYLSRTLRFVAGVGGKAYAEALTQTETISDIDGVERTQESVLPDGKSQARFTLGTILGALLPNPEQALNQAAQHTAPPGYPVALMFIDAVSIPLAKGGSNGR